MSGDSTLDKLDAVLKEEEEEEATITEQKNSVEMTAGRCPVKTTPKAEATETIDIQTGHVNDENPIADGIRTAKVSQPSRAEDEEANMVTLSPSSGDSDGKDDDDEVEAIGNNKVIINGVEYDMDQVLASESEDEEEYGYGDQDTTYEAGLDDTQFFTLLSDDDDLVEGEETTPDTTFTEPASSSAESDLDKTITEDGEGGAKGEQGSGNTSSSTVINRK